jgi:hypothetical protein
MHTLKRITTNPGSALTIQVDHPTGDGDGGFQVGGVYLFMPAGQDGDTHQVGEHAAQVIMGDPGLAAHFSCDPPLPQPDGASGGKGSTKKAGKGSVAPTVGE